MPAVIGAGGVERIIEIDLNKAEQKMFEKSVAGRAGALRSLRRRSRPNLAQEVEQRRQPMNIHEYQAKALLKSLGAPVADGVAVFKAERGGGRGQEAARAALCGEEPDPCRRPRQGQVQGTWRPTPRAACGWRSRSPTSSPTSTRCWATRWSPSRPARPASRSTASTSRTAPTSTRELYLSLLVDRSVGRVAFVVSTEGGMDIEAVAHDTPEKIVTVAIDPETGVTAPT